MTAQEFIRSLLDMLDQKPEHATMQPQAQLTIVDVPEPEHADNPHAEMNVDSMVPPLQQKMELLKKAVGVDSIFDQDSQTEPDQLDIIKSLAGMNPGAAAAFTAGEDNDIVG
jgi:hypothetical protein